jgi:hypothetical protein
MTGKIDLDSAYSFIWSHGRLLERRQLQHGFFGGTAESVAEAIGAYQNPGGGSGEALEPDCRTPHSQPEATR